MSLEPPSLSSPAAVRIVADRHATAEWPATAKWLGGLSTGQRFYAQVLEVSLGGAWLEIAGRRLLAESRVPLEAGRSMYVEVSRVADRIELRLLQGGAPGSARPPVGLDALLSALDALAGTAPVDGAGIRLCAGLDRLRQSGWSGMAGPDLDRLAALLRHLPADVSAEALAVALRDRAERSGWLFEARLRTALVGGASSAEEALAGLVDDLRVLLGRLALAAGGTARAEAPAGRGVAAPPASSAPGALAETIPLGDEAAREVLQRQIEEAARWHRDGAFVLDLPFSAGHELSHARIIVRRDRHAAGEAPADARPRVEVRVETRALGRVEAQASWSRPSFQARLVVERPAVRALFEGHAGDLRARLAASGFTQATIEILCDPVRLAHPAPLPGDEPPPGGSLVDVRG